MKVNLKNEKVKRKYFKWCRDTSKYTEISLNSVEKAILLYEDFTKHADFGTFSQSKATQFKKWLSGRRSNGKPLSATTLYHHLRHLRNFFAWLSGQAGYKSKVKLDNVSYLSLEREKVREALSRRPVKFPSLEYVKKLAESIGIDTEIDRRDRALIAFLLLSGMRDRAVATLPLGCFDRKTLEIRQDPRAGVKTKFSKYIASKLLRFDDSLVQYMVEWAEFLVNIKLFGSGDPLFPRSKAEQVDGGLAYVYRTIEPVFWKSAGPIREILKKRATQAGLEYYKPHSFRHAAASIALRSCRSGEQYKAISQNFGHEYIATTLLNYGNLDDSQVGEIIDRMDFDSSSESEISQGDIDRAIMLLSKMKKKT